MNKRIDMSVLPDGFLIQHKIDPKLLDPVDRFDHYSLGCMDKYFRDTESRSIYRPALNHWHFNDGSMVLPDGLVVLIMLRDGRERKTAIGLSLVVKTVCISNLYFQYSGCDSDNDAIAVKILGVTKEYAEHGKELGMDVVTI